MSPVTFMSPRPADRVGVVLEDVAVFLELPAAPGARLAVAAAMV
jgi:hypothetical protein